MLRLFLPLRQATFDAYLLTLELTRSDDDGLYDTQYEGRTEPDCRGRLHTDENGYYSVSPLSRVLTFASLSESLELMVIGEIVPSDSTYTLSDS